MRTIKGVIHDLVKLRLPITAAAMVTTLVGLLQPFGIDLSHQSTRLAAAFALIGVIAAAIDNFLNQQS